MDQVGQDEPNDNGIFIAIIMAGIAGLVALIH